MEHTGLLFFDVDARHVRQLGRELVADRITAVSELIKNAYDADATLVDVIFEGASATPGGTLIVRDDGVGMTLEDLKRGWMRISTDFKERGAISPLYHRARAGRKGIGRFAAETLGRVLTLTSVARGAQREVSVVFDWERAYIPGADLGDIGNAYDIRPADPSRHGTTLRIDGLHDAWDREAVDRIQRAVLLLQPPFQTARVAAPATDDQSSDPGFVVRTFVDGEESSPVVGLEEFLNAATANIEGSVDESGGARITVRSQQLGLEEHRKLERPLLATGPFSFRASYFVYSRDALMPTGSVSLAIAQGLGARFGGVRLYRDGLRILPYGEPHDDWLRLDAAYRKRSVLVPIAKNNYFGEVFVTRAENVLLIDTASREGVVENEAFFELRDFVADALIWGAQQVGRVRRRKGRAGGTAPRAELQSRKSLVEAAIASARRIISARNETERSEASADFDADARAMVNQAERSDRADARRLEDLLNELELLRILASLGAAISVFSHELRGVVNASSSALEDVEEALDAAGDVRVPNVREAVTDAKTALDRLSELGGYIEAYISQSRRRQRAPQALHEVIDTFFGAFERTINRSHIFVQHSVSPPSLRTAAMSRSELEAVLFNFLTNSIKALDREGLANRRIAVDAQEVSGRIVLRFQDTGRGIDPAIRDAVFEPFVTSSSASDSELGTGTGLGLKIVADIAEANGGSVRVADADPPFVTCFELTLPQWHPEETK